MQLRSLGKAPPEPEHRPSCGAGRLTGYGIRMGRIFDDTPPWVRNAGLYLIALGLLIWLAKDVPGREFRRSLTHANPWLFVPVAALSVVLWLLGESFLYSRLFTYFHCDTTFGDMVPVIAAQELLQVVNSVAAGTTFVSLVHRRKGVPWLSAGGTLAFQSFVDFQVILAMMLVAALLIPGAPLVPAWYYPAAALAVMWTAAWLWHSNAGRLRVIGWLRRRPAMSAFHRARLADYLRLMPIRAAIFTAQGLVLYLELLAFGMRAPFLDVLAFVPASIIVSSLPITPAGLGTRQAIIVLGLGRYGSTAALFAMSLAHSAIGIPMRALLALLFARALLKGARTAKI